MRIEREKVPVIIYMKDFKIEGNLHIPPGGRLTDFINISNKQFIPVTDAVIYNPKSESLYNVGLMQVNKNFIQALFPKEEVKE